MYIWVGLQEFHLHFICHFISFYLLLISFIICFWFTKGSGFPIILFYFHMCIVSKLRFEVLFYLSILLVFVIYHNFSLSIANHYVTKWFKIINFFESPFLQCHVPFVFDLFDISVWSSSLVVFVVLIIYICLLCLLMVTVSLVLQNWSLLHLFLE